MPVFVVQPMAIAALMAVPAAKWLPLQKLAVLAPNPEDPDTVSPKQLLAVAALNPIPLLLLPRQFKAVDALTPYPVPPVPRQFSATSAKIP